MLLGVDTETFLIEDDNKTPELVCMSVAWEDGLQKLFSKAEALLVIEELLQPTNVLVFHNAPFDLAVLMTAYPQIEPLIWRAYRAGRIKDTQTRQKLIDLRTTGLSQEKGAYILATLAKTYCNADLDKSENGWRLRYSQIANVPIQDWPADATRYALEDAKYTLEVYKAQTKRLPPHTLEVTAEQRQAISHWALHLTSLRGLRTDPEAVARLGADLERELAAANEILIAADIYHRDKKSGGLKLSPKGAPTKNMTNIKALIEKAYAKKEIVTPVTEKGNVCTDEQTLSESGDPILETLASISGISKIKTAYLPLLETCITKRIQTNFNPMLETGRTSSFKPNVQQWPRKGAVRECLIPEPGYVFVSCDYDTLELRCIAQILLWRFGTSKMAEAIRAGKDLHLMVAAQLARIDYATAKARYDEDDEEIVDKRQLSKVANFGFCGGMGPDTFVKYAGGSGVNITRDQSFELRQVWLETWPEMNQYFRVAAEEAGDFGSKTLTTWISKRQITGVSFTSFCNYQFQALAADGAKAALAEVVRLCRQNVQNVQNVQSPLYGSHPYTFVHDQIILESPEDKAPAAGEELCKVMVSEMQKWTPDVPISASPVLMERWYKGAKTIRNEKGELQIWRPKT